VAQQRAGLQHRQRHRQRVVDPLGLGDPALGGQLADLPRPGQLQRQRPPHLRAGLVRPRRQRRKLTQLQRPRPRISHQRLPHRIQRRDLRSVRRRQHLVIGRSGGHSPIEHQFDPTVKRNLLIHRGFRALSSDG
jgi:hypothetical protein